MATFLIGGAKLEGSDQFAITFHVTFGQNPWQTVIKAVNGMGSE
jgi:hypothetical protein